MGAGGADNTSAIVFGGAINTSGGDTVNAEQWNGTSWTEVANLSTERFGLGGSSAGVAASIGFGGTDNDDQLANTEEWVIPFVTKTVGTD